MELNLATFIFLLMTSKYALIHSAYGADWTYEGDGPSQWTPKVFCIDGKRQSPIDIPASKGLPHQTYKPFIFHGYNFAPKFASMINNGHSVQMTVKANPKQKSPTVTHGGLDGTYKFAQLHLHWGSSNEKGSEHIINGKSFPMELHLVHYKSEYGNSIGTALAKQPGDGLAVLGIFFEIQDKDNKDLKHLIDCVSMSTEVNNKVDIDHTFPLEDLLPRNTDRFYRYDGSLTTPGCNEVVVWTVFKDPIGISQSQLDTFRKVLKSGSSVLVDNFRPVQSLNNRKILDVDTSTKLYSSATLPYSSVNFVAAIVLSLALASFI